jgi:hypothetical protein
MGLHLTFFEMSLSHASDEPSVSPGSPIRDELKNLDELDPRGFSIHARIGTNYESTHELPLTIGRYPTNRFEVRAASFFNHFDSPLKLRAVIGLNAVMNESNVRTPLKFSPLVFFSVKNRDP